ncbi:tumor necrosis factor ligand superfamily member 18 isoform X2 [Labeo rohita]|uniref:tumor necrosis factor ligand superfamily member 18 isoform X2 n=1 Tax=Labeo rohita TaxID=84645 RepID=UPI0021E2F657|nr:tumor necrosis factor ligand superfamily member 18 isoform X2 [Labeo rohita]
MSLSAEYYTDKTGDRGGGGGAAALAHQRRLIQGLLVWATLLTLGLGVSITLHFIHRDSPASSKVTVPADNQAESKDSSLMRFAPAWDRRENVTFLTWTTNNIGFIKGKQNLTVTKHGEYFLYLQLTLDHQQKAKHTITVRSQKQEILKGFINGSKSVFMANGIFLDNDDILTVTCEPGAKIMDSHAESYLGVIKLNST